MSRHKVTFPRLHGLCVKVRSCEWSDGKNLSPISASPLSLHHQSKCTWIQRNIHRFLSLRVPCRSVEALQKPGELRKLCRSLENFSFSGHCKDKRRYDWSPQKDSFPWFQKGLEQKDQLSYINRYQIPEAPTMELLSFVRVLGDLFILGYLWVKGFFIKVRTNRTGTKGNKNCPLVICKLGKYVGCSYFRVNSTPQLLFTSYL